MKGSKEKCLNEKGKRKKWRSKKAQGIGNAHGVSSWTSDDLQVINPAALTLYALLPLQAFFGQLHRHHEKQKHNRDNLFFLMFYAIRFAFLQTIRFLTIRQKGVLP